jgi:DNA-binding HxlR family transcriptional regulator
MGVLKGEYRSIVSLCHYRWAIPVVAELSRTDGSKFVTLAAHLGVARDALKRTLTALIEQGLVQRNPGYGHPLRPEYLLTDAGRSIGPACRELAAQLTALGVEDVGLHKWSLPLLTALRDEARHFSELKNAFPGVTARAVTLALKELGEAGLVERVVLTDRYPPATVYRLKTAGAALARLGIALAASSGAR